MSGNFHYTKNTVEATRWCNKCAKQTRHQVLGGKLAGCLDCRAKHEQEMKDRKAPEPLPDQGRLF